MSFEYSKLPQEFPRKFLRASFDAADLPKLKQIFDELQQRELVSEADVEKWLADESELAAATVQEQAMRYIRMTCQTDDAEREKAYLFFVENVEPFVKLRFYEQDRKYVDTPARRGLPPDQYFVLDRRRMNNVALFRKESVELEKEESLLSQRY